MAARGLVQPGAAIHLSRHVKERRSSVGPEDVEQASCARLLSGQEHDFPPKHRSARPAFHHLSPILLRSALLPRALIALSTWCSKDDMSSVLSVTSLHSQQAGYKASNRLSGSWSSQVYLMAGEHPGPAHRWARLHLLLLDQQVQACLSLFRSWKCASHKVNLADPEADSHTKHQVTAHKRALTCGSLTHRPACAHVPAAWEQQQVTISLVSSFEGLRWQFARSWDQIE